ncbi:MAG: DNA polymerase II small subunit, partial [Methanomicrobiales archaeon]|nr:DNA polymerase II small subunit [Methanomicrobiales archaeon]
MLSEQEIVERFLATRLQVHPDVLSYLREKNDPALVDRIIAGIPPETLVVSTRHLPDLHREKDGARFAADPSVELISGAAGTAGSTNRFEDFFQYFRDRYTRLSEMIRTRTTAIPIEALVKTTRYRQQEAAAIGMVMDVRTTGRGNRLVELEDPTGQITVLFNHDRPVFADAERILPDEV